MVDKDKAIELARQVAESYKLFWCYDYLKITHKMINGDPCWCVLVVNDHEQLTLDPAKMSYFISMVTGKCVGYHIKGKPVLF